MRIKGGDGEAGNLSQSSEPLFPLGSPYYGRKNVKSYLLTFLRFFSSSLFAGHIFMPMGKKAICYAVANNH
jgi:hypothetical protein